MLDPLSLSTPPHCLVAGLELPGQEEVSRERKPVTLKAGGKIPLLPTGFHQLPPVSESSGLSQSHGEEAPGLPRSSKQIPRGLVKGHTEPAWCCQFTVRVRGAGTLLGASWLPQT